MSRKIDEIKSYYEGVDNSVLQNIADSELESLDTEVQTVVLDELKKRGLSITEENNEEVKINEDKLNSYIQNLRTEQNFQMAIVAGAVAAIIGGLLWAAVTVSTGYQIGYMAIAIGFIVGYAVKIFGKGLDNTYGIVGAAFALLGCVLGNYFTTIAFIAPTQSLGYIDTLLMIDISVIPSILMETFSPMDVLFYGIALYQGYKLSFRDITEEEIINNAVD